MNRLVRVGLVVLMACGTAVTLPAPETDAGVATPDGGTGGGRADGGLADAGGSPFDAGARYHGYVSIQTELTSAGSYYQAWAVFERAQGSCQGSTVGDCTISLCQRALADGGSLPFEPSSSAGLVTITGGVAPITLEVQADGGYTAKNVQNVVYFQGGETLSATAAGNAAGVGAFAASVVAPTVPTVTSWVAAPVIDRSSPFQVRWSTGGPGVIEVTLADATFVHLVSCRFDRQALTGALPAAALQSLPAGAGRLDVVVAGVANVRVGDWEVEFDATRHAAIDAGSLALGPVTLQ